MTIPKHKTKKFFPGLVDQHVVTLEGVGVSAVQATVAANTAMTDAQIIAGPSGNEVAKAASAFAHSLGIAPTAVIPVVQGGLNNSMGVVSYHVMTANNSAVFLRCVTDSAGLTRPLGVATKIISIR